MSKNHHAPDAGKAQRVIITTLRAWIGSKLNPNGKYRVIGSLDAEAEGEAHWRSVNMDMEISNPSHPGHEYVWDASSGKLPHWYKEERMVEIENCYGGSVYFMGQAAWVQFSDGEIFMTTGRQYYRDDGRRSSWIQGCFLREKDFRV